MSLRARLAPPVFPEDEKKTLRARLINYALLANFVMMLGCAGATVLAGGQITRDVLVLLLGFAGFSLLLRTLLFSGRVTEVCVALLGCGFVATTLAVASVGTIRAPLMGFYLALVIGAGILFELKGAVILGVLGSLATGGLILAENHQLLPRPSYPVGLTQWLITTALLAAVGGWTYAALDAIRGALRRAEHEVTVRTEAEALLRERNRELAEALGRVKTLSGMLPICSGCKKIRDDRNYWHQVESYIADHTEACFTHSLCPVCVERYYSGLDRPDLINRAAAGQDPVDGTAAGGSGG